MYSIGTLTYSLWLRFTILHALISGRHSSSLDTDSLWTVRSGVRNLLERIFSSLLTLMPALRPASPPQRCMPWLFPGEGRPGRGVNHPRLSSRLGIPHLPSRRSFMARYWETVTNLNFHGRKNLKYMRIFTFCSDVVEVFVLEYCTVSKDSFVNAVSRQRVFCHVRGQTVQKMTNTPWNILSH